MVSIYDGCKSFTPSTSIRAHSVEDVKKAIHVAADSGLAMRPMGLGYSWSEHSFTKGISLRMDAMRRLCRVDPERKTVTVDAGVRIGDVTKALGSHGLCLPSLAFLPEMTAGGAVATATHGTNHRYGTISDFANSIDIVIASGELKHFSPTSVSGDEMRAARVAVGMLGVITRVEFQAIDIPWARYTELNIDLDDFMSRRQSILERFDHVWAHWTLGTNTVKVECLETRAEPADGFRPYVTHRNAVWQAPASSPLKDVLRPAWRRLQDVVRPSISVTRAKSPSDARTSMQYAVSQQRWETIVDALRDSDFARCNAGRLMEMKFVKGNDLSILGPNTGQDAVCFNVYWMVPRAELSRVLIPLEDIMKSFNARPHWGKDHTTPSVAYLARAYPEWAKFEAVRKKYDSKDMFLAVGT